MTSTSGRFLLGVLLGAVLGGGAAYLATGLAGTSAVGTPEPALEAPSLSSTGSRDGSDSARDTILPELSSREVVRPINAAVHRDVEVSDGEVDDLLASIETPEIRHAGGEGAIFGRITDGDSNGVDGVVLRAQKSSNGSRASSPSSVGRDAPELTSLEETVRKAVEDYSRWRSDLYETRTDATGAYRFDGLPNGSWRIFAFKRDHVISPLSSSYEVRPGTELDFRAEPVISVPVSVYTPAGSLAHEAVLGCDAGSGRSSSRFNWSPEEATLRLEPGAYEITALSADSTSGTVGRGTDADQKSESQRVVLRSGETPPTLRFDLAGRLGIRGRVSYANDGVEGMNPRVYLLALASGEQPDLEALSDSDESSWVRSGREYNFLDLDPGFFAVGVSRSYSGTIEVHEVVEVTDGITRCDLELPSIDRSQYLRATVLDPAGDPVSGVDFRMRFESEGRSWTSGMQELRDRDGTYLLGFRQDHQEDYFGDSRGGTFALTASHETYGQTVEQLQPGQLEVTMVLTPPAELEVTIAGYQGSGYEGRLSISANRIDDEGGGTFRYGGGHDDVNSSGVKKFEQLAPGRYALSLYLESEDQRGWGPGRQIDRIEISVAAGENYATMAIPALYSFDVIYADGKEGATFGLSRNDGEEAGWWGGFQADLDAKGVARFVDVPSGDYVLRCWSGRSQQMQIRVPCKNIEFVPMILDALLVSITDDSGDLARLGFREGDLIVGIDGGEFDGEPDMSLLSPLYASKSASMSFLLERGGDRLEIVVTGAEIGDWSSLGGDLEPTGR